ncbi:MAG: hypothetical protein RJQ08_11760 [Salinisphaeraceae bacterium]
MGDARRDPWGNEMVAGVVPALGGRSGYRVELAGGETVFLAHEDHGGPHACYARARTMLPKVTKRRRRRTSRRRSTGTPQTGHSRRLLPAGSLPDLGPIRRVRFVAHPPLGIGGVTAARQRGPGGDCIRFLALCSAGGRQSYKSFSASKYGVPQALRLAIESRLAWERARYDVEHVLSAGDWVPIALQCFRQFWLQGEKAVLEDLDIAGSFRERGGAWHARFGRQRARFDNQAYAHRGEARGAAIQWCMQQGGEWDAAAVSESRRLPAGVQFEPRHYTRYILKANQGRTRYLTFYIRLPGVSRPGSLMLYVGRVNEVSAADEAKARAHAEACVAAWRTARARGQPFDLSRWRDWRAGGTSDKSARR